VSFARPNVSYVKIRSDGPKTPRPVFPQDQTHHVGQSPDLGVCSPSLAGEFKPSKVAASSILQIGMAGEQ
jgi:hypothetical protein